MEKEKKVFGLHKNVFFLGLTSFFNDLSNQMIQSVMPVFLSVTLGVTPAGVGLIEGAADAIASFLKIFSGWFSDKIGKRKLPAFFGYALSVAVRPFFAFVASFPAVLKLRVIDRIGKGFREAPRDALLSESSCREDMGKSFGYQRMLDALGGVLGPLGAVLILPLIGNSYPTLFLIAFGFGLLVLFSFLFIKEIKRSPDGERLKLNFALFKESREFSVLLLSIFIFGLGTLPITLMLLRPIENGSASFGNIPLIYFVYSSVFVLGAIPLGRLSDKIGARIVISLGFIFAMASYICLAFSSGIRTALLAFAFFGVYSAATDGVERALAAKLVNPGLLATGQGFLNAAVGISSLLAGVIGGIVWTEFGARYAFLYSAVVSFVGLIFFLWISFGKKRTG